MKKAILPILVYLIACIITIFLPTSEENNTVIWKLLVGQIYAIPALLIAVIVVIIINKKLSHS